MNFGIKDISRRWRGGKDIKKAFQLSPEVDTFWDRIKQRFKFVGGIKAYVSDSHAPVIQNSKRKPLQCGVPL
jgi:hypothetical protein